MQQGDIVEHNDEKCHVLVDCRSLCTTSIHLNDTTEHTNVNISVREFGRRVSPDDTNDEDVGH